MSEGEWSIEITPTLLFRFSALTYNGHRIHYDRDYARDIEGYPGLVTHGPLQALAMAEAARARGVTATAFAYRLVAPLFEHQGLVADRRQLARDLSGRQTARPRSRPMTRPPRAPRPGARALRRASPTSTGGASTRRANTRRSSSTRSPSRGLLAALIPTEYGGLGLGLTEASVIMEEINRSGGHSAACHAQMYTMGAVLRHGSDAQKRAYLPGIASGELRLQAFSITEDAGRLGHDADRHDRTPRGRRVRHRRPQELDQPDRAVRPAAPARAHRTPEARANGLSLFLIDLRARARGALEITPVRTMFNYATNQVRYRGLRVPADSLIGEEGQGFRYVIDGWNAERILLAAEAIGDGYWFTERATAYANTREVFGRPIGANQGVQFPIAHAYMQVRAADLMRYEAARRFDAGEPCGAEANMAKLLSSEASWAAANACLDTHGGYGFVDAYDVERKFRETRLYKVAPVNNNLVTSFVATKVLGLPRSY